MQESPGTQPSSKLFRQEALDARRPQPYGDIVLLPGGSSRWMALAALALMVGLVLLISLGSYTRRSTVLGQLVPSEGLIKVLAAQGGVIAERHAVDGQVVRRGDLLFVLSGDRAGPDALEYQRAIGLQIETRRKSLEEDLRRSADAEQTESAQLRRRIASLRSETERVTRQGGLLAQRVKSAEDAVLRYQGLFGQGYASRDELTSKENELSELRTRLEGQRRDSLTLEREIGTAQRELDALNARYANQRAELQRSIALTRQEYAEIEARRRIAVSAPADGRLTLVQAEVGQTVDPSHALAQLVPRSSKLIARLYVPSRSAGFVTPGTTVLLRYDAFPYQKFGQHASKVASVSSAAVAPIEIQGLAGAGRPELLSESLFAVTVALPGQSLSGPNGALPLQSGMRVEADLLHETRPLYEWILEPLYAAKARLKDG